MITRITRLLLLLQFFIAVGAGAVAALLCKLPLPWTTLAAAACVALVRMLIVANNFVLASRYRSPTPAAYRLGARRACAMFFGEFAASMRASSWYMPFFAFSERVAPAPAALPVLLVHGYGCNSGYWHPFSRSLQRAGISHHAIDLEPIAGGIDEYVPALRAAVTRLADASGQPVVIVGHSMGGLAARAYLRRHGAQRIARIITIGTPHHGTALARFGVGVNTAQMRWVANAQEGMSSAWLHALAAEESEASRRLITSLYSYHDNIVSPQASAHLQGAKNIALGGIGHVALGFHPDVHTLVIAEITALRKQSAGAAPGSAQSQPDLRKRR